MADQEQTKATGGMLLVLAGVAGSITMLGIVVVWAFAYGPLS